ncbi:MAG: putative Ig domain-containing protein [bacterium]|nr:putative Ig domain-containing protein [bacterium]
MTAFPASLRAAGTCLDFNPWYDMVEVPADPDLNVSQMTVEVWVLLTEDLGLLSGYAILDKNLPPEPDTTPADSNYLMFIEGINDYRGNPSQYTQCVGWSIGNGISYARVYSQTKAPDLEGEWHHVAGTYDGSTLSLYIDGQLENSIPTQLQPVHNNGLLTLGWSPVGYLLSWNGRLDEVRVWNRCRTPQEINRTMNVRMTGTEQGLVAYWNLDEGAGQDAHDLAGDDNHGQLGSTPEPDEQDPEWSPLTAPCDVPLEIVSTSPLPDAKKGNPYTFTFEAKGGYWNYAWSVASGSLPSGLSLSENGVLSGTPGEYGDFSFTVEVTDRGSPPATDSAVFDLHVSPPEVVITTTTLPAGVEGQAYSETLQAQGGIPPYRWTVVSSGLPDGLSLNPNTGVLSGTPTNAAIGTWAFNVQAEDSQSPPYTDTQVFSLTIAPAADLVIGTASPLPAGKVGAAYSMTFTASGGRLPHSWDVTSGAPPNGLSLAADGVLSGTPQEYGQFQFAVRVSDSQDPADTASKQYALTISPADIVIQTASLPSGTEGIAYSQTLQAAGGATPYVWQVVGGVLPQGLTLNGSSGTISGTPTNAAIGTWNFIVRVSDSRSPPDTDDQGYSVSIAAGAADTITSSPTLPDGKVGEAYAFTFTARGGKLPHVWEVESGSPPPSLNVSSGGTLSGTPTARGDFTFVVRVEDSQQIPDSDSQQVIIHIEPADVAIQTTSLPDGTEGQAYNAFLVAADGIEPYSWRIIAGTLPQGLTLSGGGVITGTPPNAAIGTWSFTVEVSDSQSPPSTDTRAFSLTIIPAKPLSIVTFSPLPDGKVGESYGFAFTATGGKLPYTWDVASGTLPQGLNLGSDGRLSGVPTQYGDFSFVIRVTDSQQTPDTDAKGMAIRILPADLVITTNSLADGVEGSAYSQSLSAAGGIPPYTWQLSAGALPDGLSLGASGIISGIPGNDAIGTASFTVRVSDSQSQPATDERALSITVHPSGSLVITTAGSLPDGKVGQIYNASLAASGGKLPYVWSLDGGSLPQGLNLSADGTISGTPALHGDSQFTLRVTDSQNPPASVTRSFSIHVSPADLRIATESLSNGIEGAPYQQALQATGGVQPLTWAIVNGTLPEGLILNAVTGLVSGTPTNAAIGQWSVTVAVSDSQIPAGRDERTFILTVAPASQLVIMTASPLPDGKLGVPYNAAFAATGGKVPYAWQVVDGRLPAGLTFNGAGSLTGTPTEHGDFAFTIEVADSQTPPARTSRSFSLRIAPADLVLVTSVLSDGVEGRPYIHVLEASGGVSPYIWRVVSGSLPDGLTLNQSTGTVSGTPTNAAIGVSTFVIRVEDSQAPPAASDRQFSIAITPSSELTIVTESPLPDGKVGEPYNQTFLASGGKVPYAWTMASGQLPQGLALSADGTLSGTPVEHGSFAFNVRVDDSLEPPVAAVKLFALTIAPADLRIITLSLPSGREGVAYSTDLEATGGVVPYTWTIVAGALPDGLVLSSATGRVSGIPTNAAIGEWVLTIRVRDSQASPAQDEQEFRLTVEPAQSLSIETTSPLPTGKVDEAYSQALVAAGGKRPYAWSLVSGSLPSGLTLTADGTLQGTTIQHGDFAFGVRVVDSQATPEAATREFSLHISASELEITTVSLPDGIEGAVYQGLIEVAGGVSPFTWSLTGGSLPDGLTLDSATGIIGGTPTTAAIGSSSFTVRVTDSQSPPEQDERTLSIAIRPAEELRIMSSSPLPEAKVGESYRYDFAAGGGKPPYSWRVASGSLPGGLILSSDGTLSGTPLQHGDYAFDIEVNDSQSPADAVRAGFSVRVSPADLTIATTSLPSGKEGTLYRQVLEAKGGVLPYAWSLAQGALPDGLRLDQASGVISGTPTNLAIGTSIFTVRVADSQSPADTAERQLSITIIPKSPLQIATGSPLPDGKVGEPFALVFAGSGGKLPYSWSIASGALPPGLIMGPSGELNGTPTEPGEYTFTIRVTDSQQPRASAEKQFSVYIAPREITLEVNPTSLAFSTRRGGSNPPSQSFTIRVRGIARVTWQALEDCGWLMVDPVTGTNAGEEDIIAVSVNKLGLDVGTYGATIDVVPLEAPEKHVLVEVTLKINPIRVPQDYPTIQEGVNAAKPSDVVLVSPGLYRERVVVGEGVHVVGSGAEQTTIDALGQGTVVALLGNGSSVEGFTVRNGVGDYFGNGSRVGGGIYCEAASATISKCTIVGNEAVQGWGGGVFVKSGCSLLIVEAEISGNSAESGGGIFCHENSRLRVERSRFRENVAEGFGGGICCIDLALAMVTGCQFSLNSAGYSGGAIAGNNRSGLTIVNCTFVDNLADEGGGIFGEYGSSVSLVNSLLWNTFSDLAILGTASVRYCNIRDGSFVGENHNFSADPRFVKPIGRDYHLLPNSPCVDIGDGTPDDLTETDLDGEPRVLQGYGRLEPDIGADELNPETVFALIPSPPVAGENGLVTVNYTLWNARARISSIAADYSADGAESWYPAARARSSESTRDLSTSADGKAHSFVWDSIADLGGGKEAGLRMRIRPLALKAHYPATSEAFALDNSLADSDNDKLPDLWETQIVDANAADLILTVADVLPNDDFDGDGQTNGFEYLTGASPVDKESLFGVQLSISPDGGVNLSWSSVTGKTYSVEYCEELGGAWLPLGSAQAGTGGILRTSDEAPPGRKRFYRLIAY